MLNFLAIDSDYNKEVEKANKIAQQRAKIK